MQARSARRRGAAVLVLVLAAVAPAVRPSAASGAVVVAAPLCFAKVPAVPNGIQTWATNRAGSVAVVSSLPPTGGLARVDLVSGAVTTISVPTGATDLRVVAVSDDASLVLLDSSTDGLVGSDSNGRLDTFVLDVAAHTFDLVDRTPAGAPGSTLSTSFSISGDGRFVAFQSDAPELAPGGGPGAILLRDRTAGTTVRIDAAPTGLTIAYVGSARLSRDGGQATYRAVLSTGVAATFVRDRVSGNVVPLPLADWVVSDDGRHAWGVSGAAGPLRRLDLSTGAYETFPSTDGARTTVLAVSDDDRWVLYQAAPAGTAVPLDTNPFFAQYLLDRTSGAVVPAASAPGAVGGAVRQLSREGHLIGTTATEIWRAAPGIPQARLAPTPLVTNSSATVVLEITSGSSLLLPSFVHGNVPTGAKVTATLAVDPAAPTGDVPFALVGPTGCEGSLVVPIVAGTPPTPPGPAPIVDTISGFRVLRPAGRTDIVLHGAHLDREMNVASGQGVSASLGATDFYSAHVTLGADGSAPLGYRSLTADNRGDVTTLTNAVVVRNAPGEFEPVEPRRLYDSRQLYFGPTVPLGPGETRVIRLGAAGARGVPSAMVVNVTAVDPSSNTYLTVFPPGTPRPTASSLNVARGETRANLVMVGTNGGGEIQVYNNAGTVDLVVDAVGVYDATDVGDPRSAYLALDPERILDSRVDLSRPFGAREYLTLPIVRPGAPVRAALLNVTVTNTTAPSYLSVVPAGQNPTLSSNINWTAGATTPNLVVVPVSANGEVDIYNNAGKADVIVDIVGLFDDGTLPRFFGQFGARSPLRVLDTRTGLGAAAGVVDPAAPLTLDLDALGAVPREALAVVMNVTVTEAEGPGHVSVWPIDVERPASSNLNFAREQTAPNLVVVPLNAGNAVRLGTGTSRAHLIADVVGWFGPSGAQPPTALSSASSRPSDLGSERSVPGDVLAEAAPLQLRSIDA